MGARARPLIIVERFWPLTGGPEVTLARLAAELQEANRSPTVLTLRWQDDWPEMYEYHGIRVVRVAPPGRGLAGMIGYVARLKRWMKEHHAQFDVAYVSELKLAAFAAVSAGRRRFPVVLRAEHAGLGGDCHWQLDAPCGERIKRRCRQADALVAASAAIEQELIAAGYARDRIFRLAPGVRLAAEPSAASRVEARAALAELDPQLAIDSHTPLVVYVGRLLAEEKGLVDLVAAWRLLADSQPAARLWLVGDGPDRDRLREQVIEAGLLGRVAFAGSFDDVDDFYRAADLFVMPSRESRTSVAVLEAMAAGLPVVATDTLEMRAILPHDHDDWLVRPGSPAELAAAIGRVLSRPEEARLLSERARRRVAKDFSLEQMVESHLRLFDELVN